MTSGKAIHTFFSENTRRAVTVGFQFLTRCAPSMKPNFPGSWVAVGMFLVCLLSAGSGLAQTQTGTADTSLPSGQGQTVVPADATVRPNRASNPVGLPVVQDQTSVQPVSESVRYRIFFRFLATLDEFADKLQAEGNLDAASAWRTHAQRGAGLNEQEGAILKEIGLDCNQVLATKGAELKAAATRLRAQRSAKELQQVPMTPELAQLAAERQQIFDSHMEQLKSQLGEDSFKKLDAYVKDLLKGSVTVSLGNQQSSPVATPPVVRVPAVKGGVQ